MKYKIFLIIGIALLSMTGCKSPDDIYKQYIVPGGKIYPQKPTNLIIYSGDKRVLVEWDRIVDPHVEMCVVYWNNYTDSVAVDLSEQSGDVSFYIDNLAETDYTFVVRTLDGKGNKSRDVEVNTHVYGDTYRATIYNRTLFSPTTENGIWTFTWLALDETTQIEYTEFNYYDTDGNLQSRKVTAKENVTTLDDFDQTEYVSYTTYYRPDTLTIDLFATAETRVSFNYEKIDKREWVATCDSEPDNYGGYIGMGGPANAIDDDLTTYWHTEYASFLTPPHWLAVDMKRKVSISSIEITAGGLDTNYYFDRFTLQGSNGNGWVDIKTFDLVKTRKPERYELDDMVEYSQLRIFVADGGTDPAAFTGWCNLTEFTVYGQYVD